jgi:hypothetical protein
MAQSKEPTDISRLRFTIYFYLLVLRDALLQIGRMATKCMRLDPHPMVLDVPKEPRRAAEYIGSCVRLVDVRSEAGGKTLKNKLPEACGHHAT